MKQNWTCLKQNLMPGPTELLLEGLPETRGSVWDHARFSGHSSQRHGEVNRFEGSCSNSRGPSRAYRRGRPPHPANPQQSQIRVSFLIPKTRLLLEWTSHHWASTTLYPERSGTKSSAVGSGVKMVRFELQDFQRRVWRATRSNVTHPMGMTFVVLLVGFGAYISFRSLEAGQFPTTLVNLGLIGGLAVMVYLLFVLRTAVGPEFVDIDNQGVRFTFNSHSVHSFCWDDPEFRLWLRFLTDNRLPGPDQDVCWIWGRGLWPKTLPVPVPVAERMLAEAKANRLEVHSKYPGSGPSGGIGMYQLRAPSH